MIRTITTAVALAVCTSLACAQDAIEPEKLQKVALRLMERASDQENLPLTMEVAVDKAVGKTIKEYGAVLLPAKSLSAEAISKEAHGIVPVGFLWLKGLVPASEGKPLANEKLREIKVVFEQEEHRVQLLLLGLQKKADAGFELVVLGKGKDAVLTLPLKEESREQGAPLDLDMRQGTESLGVIDVHIVGRYHAALPVAQPAP